MKLVHNLRKLMDSRSELRKQSIETEDLLWQELRNSKLGFKFRRQHSIGGYILDFYCAKARLIIELDGPIHDSRKGYDKNKDKYFNELNYKVIRFKNSEVTGNLAKVIKEIELHLSPSPKSRRGWG
jgi:very-short-patch-repair endonuclease